jgi:hypothetical protein
MIDRDRDFLQEAFAGCRTIEPTREEISRVVQTAERSRRRPRVRLIPRLAPIVASLALVIALAVPASRDAIAAGVGQLRSFLGGGSPPGRELKSSEEEFLAQLERASESRPRVLARAGDQVLAAYRDANSSRACVQFGRYGSTCYVVGSVQPKFLDDQVAPLFLTPTLAEDAFILWGVAMSGVAAIDLRYSDGSVKHATVGQSGFIAILPINQTPSEIVARDQAGTEVARGPLDPDLGWRWP